MRAPKGQEKSWVVVRATAAIKGLYFLHLETIKQGGQLCQSNASGESPSDDPPPDLS